MALAEVPCVGLFFEGVNQGYVICLNHESVSFEKMVEMMDSLVNGEELLIEG